MNRILLLVVIIIAIFTSCQKEKVLIPETQPVEAVVTLSKAEISALQKEAALWPVLTQKQAEALVSVRNKQDTILSNIQVADILSEIKDLKDGRISQNTVIIRALNSQEYQVTNNTLTKLIGCLVINEETGELIQQWTYYLSYPIVNGEIDFTSFWFDYEFDCSKDYTKVLNKTTDVYGVKLNFMGNDNVSFSYYAEVFNDGANQNNIKVTPFENGSYIVTGTNKTFGHSAKMFETRIFDCYNSDFLDMVIVGNSNVKSSVSIDTSLLEGVNSIVLRGYDDQGNDVFTYRDVLQTQQVSSLSFLATFNITRVRICNNDGCWEYPVELVKTEGGISFYKIIT